MSKPQEVILKDVQLVSPLNLFNLFIHPFRSRVSPRLRVITPIVGESMTKQYFLAECDVNNILKNYRETGNISHINKNASTYLDLSDTNVDYLATLNTIYDAQDAFLNLPALVRKRFDNDPLAFLGFVSDPKNSDELVTLGLATKKPDASGAGVSPAPGGSELP